MAYVIFNIQKLRAALDLEVQECAVENTVIL